MHVRKELRTHGKSSHQERRSTVKEHEVRAAGKRTETFQCGSCESHTLPG